MENKKKETDKSPSCFHFAYRLAVCDRDNYKEYKEGKRDFNEYELIEMKVLEILDKLGYSMDHTGTYMLKEFVVEIYESIKNKNYRESFKVFADIILNDSAIRGSLAREYLETSDTRFKNLMYESIGSVNHDNEDKDLFNKIYSPNDNYLNPGVAAYKIAEYITPRNVIGRFTATTFDDKDINFKVYDNDTIECTTLNIDFVRWINLKPRFELGSESMTYEYEGKSVREGKSSDLIKEYNIEEELFEYLKSKDMIRYSTDMAYLYNFKDKKGYDIKEQSRAFKWANPAKKLAYQRDGYFN